MAKWLSKLIFISFGMVGTLSFAADQNASYPQQLPSAPPPVLTTPPPPPAPTSTPAAPAQFSPPSPVVAPPTQPSASLPPPPPLPAVPAAPPGPVSSSLPSTVNQFQQWAFPDRPASSLNGTSLIRRRRHARVKQRPISFLESQQVMLRSVPPTGVPISEDSRTAFKMLLQQNMPLAPQQVVRLHQQVDVAQRAAATPPNIPPKPVSSTIMINLAPGTTPPAIRLSQGYVTSLVFVDSAGAPWPVASFDIGNPKAVNIQWDGKSNIILMQAMNYSSGNMVLRLVGLPTPITLELVAGQRVVDYRVDIHVPGFGPNSKDLPIGSELPANANELLLDVLDGIAPPGSRPLNVLGADCQAWLLGEKMYLRTRFTILSPGWLSTMVSPDGMHAYEMIKTSSVLISRYGEPAELRIEGF